MAVAPAVVAATALVLHLKETGNDLLMDGWCRCVEEPFRGFRTQLTVTKGRVSITDCWNNHYYDDLWLAVARKL